MMLQSQYDSPEIEELIKRIHVEDGRFDHDLRSTNREKLVLPVTILFMNGSDDVHCFSRNVSRSGICLLSSDRIEEYSNCILRIARLDGSFTKIMAVCKWSRTFGPNHWISGWQFLRMSRSL